MYKGKDIGILPQPDITMHYCRGQKASGLPLMVKEIGHDEYQTDEIYFKNVDIRVKFNNATGKSKQRGATSVLEIWKHGEIPTNN
jgi:hypothetical protein